MASRAARRVSFLPGGMLLALPKRFAGPKQENRCGAKEQQKPRFPIYVTLFFQQDFHFHPVKETESCPCCCPQKPTLSIHQMPTTLSNHFVFLNSKSVYAPPIHPRLRSPCTREFTI